MIGRRSKPPVEEQDAPKGFDDYALRLGDVMRGERATLGKSLLDVQRELKIKAPYIAAIENADPTAFETPGFIAGYVRSYARYLDLDPEWAFATFCAESDFATAHGMSAEASTPNKAAPVAQRSSKPREADPFVNPNTPFVPAGQAVLSRIEPGALGSSLVLLLLIGAIGYGGWSVLQEVQRVQFAPVNQTPGLVADVDSLAPSSAVLEADTEIAGYEAPTPDALDRLYRPEALEVPILVARDGPIAALDPSTNGTLIDGAREQPVARTAPSSLAPIDLAAAEPASPKVFGDEAEGVMLVAVRPTWVRVRAADKTVLFQKIMNAGETFVLPKTEEPSILRVGNAGALYFAVEGEAVGPAGTSGAVVDNVALSADLIRGAYEVADMTKDQDLVKVVAELSDGIPLTDE